MCCTPSNYFETHFANYFIIICPFEKCHIAEPFKKKKTGEDKLKNGENKKENHDAGEKKLSCIHIRTSYQFFNGL